MGYNADSIKSLGIIGGVREKPSSIGLENNNHTFGEILANSLDECREGYGKEIIVTKHEDGSVSVQDFGRSVPMAMGSDGRYAYDKVFNELWAGGKYVNDSEDGQYQFSLGTNGCGATGTNYTADYFEATAFAPNGREYYVKFEKGLQVGAFVESSHNNDSTGTIIRWLPSKEVFRGKGEIDDSFIIEMIKQQSIVNKGIKLIFNNKKTKECFEFFYENGIDDYIKSIDNDKSFTDIICFSTETKGKDEEMETFFRVKGDIRFAFNNEVQLMEYYHNTSYLENGGSPEVFIKNGFTYTINKYLKDKGLYSKSEKSITFEDIRDSLIIITDTYSTISLFTDQAKKCMKSDFVENYFTKFIREQLEIYFIENPMIAEKICKQVLINKNAREKSEVSRKKIKKELSEKIGNAVTRPVKLVPCTSKNKKIREIIFLEGDSALNAVKMARYALLQAIFPLKGKPLNCLKNSIDDILNNEEIKNIFRILGCGISYRFKKIKDLPPFDIEQLEYDKIIIFTDEDEDGMHIRCLLLTMFYVLAPELIKEGKVYILDSPLYRIVGNDKTYLAYDEIEKNKVLKELEGFKVNITRFKGLGGLSPKLLSTTAMNSEKRRLIQVTFDEVEKSSKILEMFLDEDSTVRKEYIEKYGHEYFDYSVYEE